MSIKIKIINTLLIVDIGIVIFCYLAGERNWFFNSQVAYLSSIIIVLASMYSYAQMVKTGVENEIITTSNDELLDKIEDPHGLYDDNNPQQALETKNDEIMTEVQDDNTEDKISTIEAMKKNKAYVSFYRIGAYAILVLGFLYLQNIKIFHMASYMFGLFLPPVLIASVFYFGSKTSKEDNENN
ncbi:MAG: hypothetical protein PHI79_03330 [Sulfurovaceae bacterium]|nr:hypothetical protein [Sulfurovaceae bacterium]MDD5548613.1 hypothetical protein [Sulfurovaceae bacterium]